jgi:hypothetical protein
MASLADVARRRFVGTAAAVASTASSAGTAALALGGAKDARTDGVWLTCMDAEAGGAAASEAEVEGAAAGWLSVLAA